MHLGERSWNGRLYTFIAGASGPWRITLLAPVRGPALAAAQPPRREATRAALIPIKKSAAWWALPQDDRRAIFAERSHHIRTGLEFLPAIARRLHHGFDLGEPFDFLTWFEYRPEDEPEFERLVAILRRSEEWRWVEREVDLRLARE
jgi:chlorite dismutase